MSGTEEEEPEEDEGLPDDTRQAVEALRRLVRKHDAMSPAEAIEAVRALLADTDVDADPEDLLGLSEDAPEESGETESPTA